MKNSCVIITGATGGIGAALTRHFAGKGAHVIMACRNMSKGEELKKNTVSEIPDARLTLMELDLARLASVRDFAGRIEEERLHPDILINNAGSMNGGFCLTHDGLESSVGINYAGTYLLTRLLVPLMPDGGHIVVTTSVTYKLGCVDECFFDVPPQSFGRFRSYGSSKLALLLFVAELSDRLAERDIAVNAADPGVVDTGMISMQRWFDPLADAIFRPLIKSPEKGALSAISAATSPAGVTGCVYKGRRCKRLPSKIKNHPYRKKLWDETEKVLSYKKR